MTHARRVRSVAAITAWAVVVQTLAAAFLIMPVLTPDAHAAGPSIALAKDEPVTVLAGGNLRYSLTVTNTGDVREYNISISDVLPFDASYLGNVDPAAAGEPLSSVDPLSGRTVLQWNNVSDLLPGTSYTLSFDVDPGPPGDTVGAFVRNDANAAASTNERQVPRFDASGNPVAGSFTESAADSLDTQITAIEITKSDDNSPEGELLRGVHTSRTVYTLEVRTTDVAGTQGVLVTDYIPAGMEFLGCGDEDNSSSVEYPGSGPLGAPALNPAPCPTPVSVDTVTDPPADNGVTLPTGVYTKVTWDLGDVPANTTVQIKYVAGIPLNANTDTWPDDRPAPESLAQGSNLDNNIQPSTRELSTEGSLLNFAIASGNYEGPTADGDPLVSDSAQHSVTIEDLRMRKSVSPEQFGEGGIATFTIVVEDSEYVAAGAITVVDVLPDGYCPLDPGSNHSSDGAADCGTGGSPPSPPFDDVELLADGGYRLTWNLAGLSVAGSATITFDARMRAEFNAHGPRAGQETSGGDSFTDLVDLSGTTLPIPGTGESGPQEVGDDSSATQNTAAPSISKQIRPRFTPADCDPTAPGPPYANSDAIPAADLLFMLGDLVCFKIRVDFPNTIATRNFRLSDFIPVDSEYVDGTYTTTAASDVPVGDFAASPDFITALLGTERPAGSGAYFVQPGGVYEATFGVRVLAPGPGPAPDLTGNLLKTSYENSNGELFGDRDFAGYGVLPASEVGLTKGVLEVDAPPSGPNGPDVDGSTVQQGSVATFRVDIANAGLSAVPAAGAPVRGVRAWDVLPLGIACSAVSAYQIDTHAPTPNTTPALSPLSAQHVTCTDPGDTGHPAVDPAYGDSGRQSVIVWAFPSPDPADTYSIGVGETTTLTYDMRLPAQISVSSRYDNTAAVASFEAYTNGIDATATYYPADNIDAAVPAEQENAQPADDPSFVITANAAPAKTQATAIVEDNNDGPGQATIGETVNYSISVTIPPHTTVYNGVLSDPLPRSGGVQQVELLSAIQTGGAGPTLTADLATDTVTLTFPGTYSNDTDAPQTFGADITARVTTAGQNTHGAARTNTARFDSNASLAGPALPTRPATTTLTVVEPAPALSKSVDPNTAIGGQTVRYELVASNAAGRPPSHDTVVVDCLPAEIGFDAVSTPGADVSVGDGDGTNGCPVGSDNRIEWRIGTLLAGTAAAQTLQYTAILDPDVVAGTDLENTALLAGSSLATGAAVPEERQYSAPASAVVHVAAGTLAKGVSPSTATIGESVTYTVTSTIPQNIQFYEASLIDTLPAGIDTGVAITSFACLPAGPDCDSVMANPGFGDELSPVGRQIGVYVGDIPPSASERFLELRYSTTVLNDPVDVRGAPNQAGATPTNSVQSWWSTDPSAQRPVSVTDPPNLPGALSGDPVTSTLTLVEPLLQIGKSVSDSTPAPGQTFDYRVTVTNGSGQTVSDAFGIEVSDVVPLGVVVAQAGITGGGVLTGATPCGVPDEAAPCGGGTITWSHPGPLGPGESVSATYSAVLAPSASLTADPLTNTAAITTYYSLPDPAASQRRTYSGPSASATVTPQFPLIETEKSTPNGATALIGEPFTWSVEVTNTGGADAFDVDTTDTLPTNFCYVSGSSSIALPDGSTLALEPAVQPVLCAGESFQQTLTWTDFTDLAVGESATITFQSAPTQQVIATPGVGNATAHTNTAGSQGDDATGADGNRTGPYSGGPDTAIARITAADLQIVKETVASPVVAGQTATFTLTVTNNGPDPAAAPIGVVDQLPPGTVLVSASGPGWQQCIAAGQQVSCSNTAGLAPGESLPPITVVVAVPSDTAEGQVLENTAETSSPTLDPDLSNNTDNSFVTVQRLADLEITKRTRTIPIVPGQNVAYDLIVRNNGPSVSAAPITVADTLDPALTFVSATGAGWTCNAAIECTRDTDLAANTAAPAIVVVARLDPAFTGSLPNTAEVTGVTPDPDPDNNTDTVTDPTWPSADLAITKATTSAVVPGQDVSYGITVRNNGPSTSRAPITVTDTLDPALTFVSATGDGWTCTAEITCVRDTDLAPGRAAPTIAVVASLDPAFTGDLPNAADVTGTTPDPDPDNNTDDVTDPAQPSADLAIVKSTLTAPLVRGGEVSYELLVSNEGPSDSAAPITVADTLPQALTFDAATGEGWACSAAGQDVTCVRDELLAAGQQAPAITITATLATDFYGDLTNTGEVTGTTPDPNPDNNSSTVVDPVPALVDLYIEKQAVGDFVVGGTGTFVLTVGNAGPTADPGPVTVTDTLPAGLSYVDATGDGWGCSAAGQVVTCVRDGEFPVGEVAPITVEVAISAAAVPEVTNPAEVSSDSTDADPTNNRSEVTVPVSVPPDTTPPTGAAVGGPLTIGALALFAGVLVLGLATLRRRS